MQRRLRTLPLLAAVVIAAQLPIAMAAQGGGGGGGPGSGTGGGSATAPMRGTQGPASTGDRTRDQDRLRERVQLLEQQRTQLQERERLMEQQQQKLQERERLAAGE